MRRALARVELIEHVTCRNSYHGHRAADAQRPMSPRPPRPPRELPLLAGSRLKNASIKDRNRVFNEQDVQLHSHFKSWWFHVHPVGTGIAHLPTLLPGFKCRT